MILFFRSPFYTFTLLKVWDKKMNKYILFCCNNLIQCTPTAKETKVSISEENKSLSSALSNIKFIGDSNAVAPYLFTSEEGIVYLS
jgi:hypothetical protein